MTDSGYIPLPATAPHYGERVVGDGRRAPQLMMRFACPACHTHVLADAYCGPITCKGPEGKPHKPSFMEPVDIWGHITQGG